MAEAKNAGAAVDQPKRRGRPPGSKNKKRKGAGQIAGQMTGKRTGKGMLIAAPKRAYTRRGAVASKGSSAETMEETIRQLLAMPTSAEVRIRLVEAALGLK